MNDYTDESGHKLSLRHLSPEDYPALKQIMDRIYSGFGGAWPENKFLSQLKIFPEGQIGIEDHGVIVAATFSVIVDYDKFGDSHTYNQITGNAYLTTHDPLGDVLYGVDVFVSPDFQGMRLGRRLYHARKELCRNLNLKSIIAGGRIPNYKNYASELSPQEYIEKVKNKDIFDPILTFQLSNDFEVKRLLTGYLPEDKESLGSVVFSPSDFAFPHDAIIAEATPNTEMTLIVDLNLEKLDKLQNEGSVRNYLDRRRDLYKIVWLNQDEATISPNAS